MTANESALVAAAYEAAGAALEKASNEDRFYSTSDGLIAAGIVRALTPASALREVEIRAVKARIEEASWWQSRHSIPFGDGKRNYADCDCADCQRIIILQQRLKELEAGD